MKSLEALAQFDETPENEVVEQAAENASVDWSSIISRITALEQTVNQIQRENSASSASSAPENSSENESAENNNESEENDNGN